MNINFQRAALILVATALLVAAGYCSFKIYELAGKRALIKTDYSSANNITYGLLSVDAWKDHLINIVSHRIDDFEFSPEQEKLIKNQVALVLHAVVNKADSLIDQKQKTFKGKMKKLIVKSLVNSDKLHAKVPDFAETIVNEIKKPANKEKLKLLVLAKISEYGALTYDSTNDVAKVKDLLLKYSHDDLETFNHDLESKSKLLSKQLYTLAVVEILIVVAFLVLWVLVFRKTHFHNTLFTFSVLLALVVLLAGLTAPMIEIDARIKEMSFLLLGEKLVFHDQIIFYQSKSIVDVVTILIETGQWDSMIVGGLILVFSIVFPMAKLISSKVYLSSTSSWRNNRFIRFFALKSGKWSMADVYVVAIFMAYIGFKGILNNQLDQLNFKTNSLASISTNETTLQPGFLLFICFVLFGLVLSTILEKLKQSAPPE